MQIKTETATVYRGGGRRWFTKLSACRAEARAKIKARKSTCDCDYCDHDEMPGCPTEYFPCLIHGDRYEVALRRLTRVYMAATQSSKKEE